MTAKTVYTKPRKDIWYIVDYVKLNIPRLLKYDFETQELALLAITNNLGNDTKRYNTIHGREARKHGIRFTSRSRNDSGRIWPDRKYNYPINESLTIAQKKNFRNKQNQRAYLERKKKRYEHLTKNHSSYIDSKPRRWRNLRNSRSFVRHQNRKHSFK